MTAADTGIVRRETQVVGLISLAHGISHFYMLVLPPLFPLIRADLGISYTELGLAVTVFAIATGLLQTPVGFLCERIGARPVLVAGLFINGAAFALIAMADSLWHFLLLMALAGLGNSVFHPADYAIIAGSVSERRVGRALAMHSFGGQLGFAVAPLIVAGMAAYGGWQFAVVGSGAMGMAMAVAILASFRAIGESSAPANKPAERASWRMLLTSPVILGFFVFFTLSSAANLGVMQFVVAALTESYGMDIALANLLLTAYMVASTVAVLPGGWIADATQRHNLILILGFGLSGLLIMLVAIEGLPVWVILMLLCMVGGLRGLVVASRDAMVRFTSPPGSVGTVFAFVTTGLLVGQTFSPMIYGFIIDMGHANGVFVLSGVFSVLCVALSLNYGAMRASR